MRNQIAPLQIGRHGQLQEWLEESTIPKITTGMSPTCGGSPGSEITVRHSRPILGRPTIVDFRGDAGTGWSLAWKINLWARLLDGDHATQACTT